MALVGLPLPFQARPIVVAVGRDPDDRVIIARAGYSYYCMPYWYT